ncbi:hypothetical protein ACQKIE_13110 [Luteibacter sp. NPDC031894]|uniref:hypothetical protein n=1 Tax=Luteibacter sp. NPDC031894 TaxID=3390572 RepID=UPI003D044738
MTRFVRNGIFAFVVCLSAACHQTPRPRPVGQQDADQAVAPASTAASVSIASATDASPRVGAGEIAVAQLDGWYQRRDANCGGATRPAFLCTGVMLRATSSKPGFLPWDPSPDGILKGGLSASWLRVDTNFPDTFRANGFIFFPSSAAPAGSVRIEVLCAFPFDGDTWSRRSLEGCGPHPSNVDRSRPCQDIGIHTAQQWLSNYYTPGYARHSHQCGWDLRIGSPSTADRFQQNIIARAGLQPEQWRFTTEVVLKTWVKGSGARMPIHSFFYRAGNTVALKDALSDQKRYFDAYHKALPIVSLTLPTSQAGRARFTFNPADQAVPLPEGTYPEISAAVPTVEGATGTTLPIDAFYRLKEVVVKVPQYQAMAAGHTVRVTWAGSTPYNTEIKTALAGGPIDFAIPVTEVIDAIGQPVRVMFTVKRGIGAPTETSGTLNLQVEPQPTAFPAPTIDATHTRISFASPALQAGVHNLNLRWWGVVVRDAPRQYVTQAGVQTIVVPAAWAAENAGRKVSVTVAVGDQAGSRYMFSRVLRIQL